MTIGPINLANYREAQVTDEARKALTYDPLFRRVGRDEYLISGKIDSPTIPWGFWGGIMSVAIAAGMLLTGQFVGFQSNFYLYPMFLLIGVGIVLFRYGPRSSLREVPLGRVDAAAQILQLSGEQPETLQFEEVTEVVFGMTRYPLTHEPSSVMVHAFSLLVRGSDDQLRVVVEASPDKGELYAIAKLISGLTGASLKQVGLGIK